LVKCFDKTLDSLEASALRDAAINFSEFVVKNKTALAFEGLTGNCRFMMNDTSVVSS